jgi:drug/metabolite transporter superfamily protein YnfA
MLLLISGCNSPVHWRRSHGSVLSLLLQFALLLFCGHVATLVQAYFSLFLGVRQYLMLLVEWLRECKFYTCIHTLIKHL